MRGGILLAVALGGLAFLAWYLVPWPVAKPVVGRVDVIGIERLDPNTVRTESGLDAGAPWTDRARARAIDALVQLPQVRTAHIDVTSRSSPDDNRVSVRVEIVERQPYGVVQLDDGQRYWVDRDGVLLERADSRPPLLPVMSGLTTTSSPEGPRLKTENGVRVLQSFYALSGDKLRRFASLRFRGYDLILHMREGWRALLPPRGLSEQIARLERVAETLRAEGAPGWRTLDLRVPGEVVIGR